MNLHGVLGDSDLGGNLLVHEAARHASHDLLLAGGQRLELHAQIGSHLLAFVPRLVALQRNLDGIQ